MALREETFQFSVREEKTKTDHVNPIDAPDTPLKPFSASCPTTLLEWGRNRNASCRKKTD